MNKKRMITLGASIALVAALGVGSTLAFFSDTENTTNVVTMGHVNIELTEPNYEGNDNDGEVINIVPNQKVVKDPTIALKGDSRPAYIRVKLEFLDENDSPLSDDAKEALIARLYAGDGKLVDSTDWYYDETGNPDYWYYKNILSATDQKVVMFDSVRIPADWGNEWVKKGFKINVTAEAIQAENFEPAKDETTGKIIGWFKEDGETPIEVEDYETVSPLESTEESITE